MCFRDCKTLSVFERKIPLTFSLESSDFTKTMHNEINLDSSIIFVIILTILIFLASKLGVPTLNII
jgi:hypothetical protein